MEVYELTSFSKGWFIGDFEFPVLKSKQFEVCGKFHAKDEKWPIHTHRIATEYTYIIKGTMIIQGKTLRDNTVFVLEPYELADPVFVTDCYVVIVKIPSVPGDKYEYVPKENK